MTVSITRLKNDPYTILFAYDVDSNLEYIGKALISSVTTDPAWQIKKLTYVSGNLESIKWADSNPLFDNIWDDRTTLTYG